MTAGSTVGIPRSAPPMPGFDPAAETADVNPPGSRSALLWQALENRTALAALEFEEARREIARLLIWALVGAVVVLLAGITMTFVVAAIYWDTPHRVLALAIGGGLELLGGVAALVLARARWRNWIPLEYTREQFCKDTECVRDLITPDRN